MQLKILKKKDVRKIEAAIDKQWGARVRLDYVLLQNMGGRIYMAGRQAFDIDETKLRIDSIGMYFGRQEKDGLRLSIEGSQIIGPKAERNVTSIEDASGWVSGHDLQHTQARGYQIIRCGSDFLGCGKASAKGIKNYYPKSRRV
jgi:NOL1/NOP2/fmu family ribosome biogenesis protein